MQKKEGFGVEHIIPKKSALYLGFFVGRIFFGQKKDMRNELHIENETSARGKGGVVSVIDFSCL